MFRYAGERMESVPPFFWLIFADIMIYLYNREVFAEGGGD